MKGALTILCFACVGGCQLSSKSELTIPNQKIWLKKELNEISGLQYLDSNRIAAVQDEKGKIYIVNPETGNIDRTIKFGAKGDYEGIAFDGNKFYVLQSNGDVHRVSPSGKTKICGFKDSKGFDFEGLCVDTSRNRLLVACKRHGKKKKNADVRIYVIDLSTFEYGDTVAFKIPKKEIKTMKDFEPSGISISPNGDIYILSSFADALLILDKTGQIKKVIHLERTLFGQPEGITFDEKGRIYISNEKRSADAVIYVFDKL
jgi:uncharacterized protein YjiK